MVTTGRLRRSVAHLQALALAASAHGIERLLLRVMLSSIRSEFDDCCLTQQPFYLHASNDTVQPETVGRPCASKVGAWPIANVQPFRSTDQLWPVSP